MLPDLDAEAPSSAANRSVVSLAIPWRSERTTNADDGAIAVRSFHNSEIGSARRLSSRGSISRARLPSAPRRTVSWRSPGRPSTPASGRQGAASGSPRTVSAQIVLFAALGRDDRRPRIPGGAAAWSFVGGVLALRSGSVRACVALAVPWRRERPPEPRLSGGLDLGGLGTSGDEWRRDPDDGLPRTTVALAGGDRTPAGSAGLGLAQNGQVPAMPCRHPFLGICGQLPVRPGRSEPIVVGVCVARRAALERTAAMQASEST